MTMPNELPDDIPDYGPADAGNNELPLGVQFAALLTLWLTWLGALGFVVWRSWKLESMGRYYDFPFVVYSIVFAFIPITLVVLGTLVLWRARGANQTRRADRVFRYTIWAVTFVAAGVLLTAGIWAFSLSLSQIRE